MHNLQFFFICMLAVQLSHSGEEYLNGMPKKFPWFKLGLRNYLLFEIPFNIFWVWVLFDPDLPCRNELMYFFIFLMLAVMSEYLGKILEESRAETSYYVMDEYISKVSIADVTRRNIVK